MHGVEAAVLEEAEAVIGIVEPQVGREVVGQAAMSVGRSLIGLAICERAIYRADGQFSARSFESSSSFGVPKGIRTPVIAVKGRCPRPG